MTTFCSIFLQDDFILTHSAVQNFPTKGVSPISREKKKKKGRHNPFEPTENEDPWETVRSHRC